MDIKVLKKQKKTRNYDTPWTPQAKLWQGYKVRLRWHSILGASRVDVEKVSRRVFPLHCVLVGTDILLRVHHNDGYAFPQLDTIAESNGIGSLGDVSDAIRKLERANMVTVFRACPVLADFILRRGDKRRLHAKQSVYVIHLPEDAAEIRDWHKERGIPRRVRPSSRKKKRLATVERLPMTYCGKFSVVEGQRRAVKV
jgi:hypothetical protein